MQSTEILEGNVLIVKFMRLPQMMHPVSDKRLWQYSNGEWYLADRLQYHTSWDWLMPVVEKIESFGLDFQISRLESYINSRGVEDENYPWLDKYEGESYCDSADTKISSVWQTIVQFIKWYNAQTRSTDK